MQRKNLPTQSLAGALTASMLLASCAAMASALPVKPYEIAPDPEQDEIVIEQFFDTIDLDELSETRIELEGAVRPGQPEGRTKVRSVSTYQVSTDDEQIVIRIVDGEIQATVNGEPIDAGRVQIEEGQIIVLGEDGQQIARFNQRAPQGNTLRQFVFPGGGGGGGMMFREGRPLNREVLEGQNFFAINAGEVPDVMVGLNMGEAGESLLQHFGLKRGEAIFVTSAIEELPAAKAGIKAGDLIVAIEGESPATPATLRDALKELDPGDTLTVTVLHKGQKRDVDITVAKYDSEKLDGVSRQEAVIGLELPRARANAEEIQQRARELAERMRAEAREGELNEDRIRELVRELAIIEGRENDAVRLRPQPRFDEEVRGFMVPRGFDRFVEEADEWEQEFEVQIERLHDRFEAMAEEWQVRFENELESRLGRLEGAIDELMARLERDDRNNRRRGGRDD